MASAPKTWLSDFAVTYNAANDAFQFTFVDPTIGTLYVSRVGFSVRWLPQLLATAATYFSRPSFETVQYDGVTVDAARCTAPVAATPQLLHAAILALYVPVSTTPQELQSFRHGSTPELLKTSNPDPSYIEKWATSPISIWDYEYNSAGSFSFPDNQSVVINEDGVYDFAVSVATRGNISLRGINLFLDTSNGSSMGSQPPNPALGSCHQSAFPPTWGGAPTLQCATLTGRAEFVAGTILRVAYVVEDDVETIADYTFWSMKLDPLVINGGAQGPPGAAGAPGTDGADGVVQTITGNAPIVVVGTAADRVVAHATAGAAGTVTYPYQVTRDAHGHVSNITTMAAPFNAVIAGADITLTPGGVAPTHSLSVAHNTVPGLIAGTYTNIASLTTNSRGHSTAIVSGGVPELLTNKNQPNGYAGLGPLGKIAAAQIPSIAITDVFSGVATHADLVTLTLAEKGDVGIVAATEPDPLLRGSWILQTDPYSTLGNWVRLLPPDAPVVYTVDGQTGPNVVTANNQLILYQLTSLVSPGDKIIRRIGNADESSYVDILNDVDITSSFDIRAQALFEVLLSAYGGVQALYMAAAYTELNLGAKPFAMTNLQSGTASNVLYYDSGTNLVTYGAAPSVPPGSPAYRAMKAADAGPLNANYQLVGSMSFFSTVAAIPTQSIGTAFGTWSNNGNTTRFTFSASGYYKATYKTVIMYPVNTSGGFLLVIRTSKDLVIVDQQTIQQPYDSGGGFIQMRYPETSQFADTFFVGQTLDWGFQVLQAPTAPPDFPTILINPAVSHILIERLADA